MLKFEKRILLTEKELGYLYIFKVVNDIVQTVLIPKLGAGVRSVTELTGGNKFDLKTENILIKLVNQPHIVGITILGGEPLELENRQDVSILLKHLKEQCPNKTIWLYSSFLYEEIKDFDVEILSYLDVLIDGPFVEALKDRKLRFRGSSNQRLIDVKKSLANDEVILYQDSRYYKND